MFLLFLMCVAIFILLIWLFFAALALSFKILEWLFGILGGLALIGAIVILVEFAVSIL